MKSKIFHFKQFDVIHDHSPMKVGFDGILLGAWVNVTEDKFILDVGTGTGLIALMMAQRNKSALIHAIEPVIASYNEALVNFQNSIWKNRLIVETTKFQDYKNNIRFDHIVCNPPFFDVGFRPQNFLKANVRHTINMSHNELLYYSQLLLKKKGKLSVILPVVEGENFILAAEEKKFKVSRLCNVITKTKIERLLIELSLNDKMKIQNYNLKIYNRKGQYSKEYLNLVKDYYLDLK